jgi:hypothetical protein
MNFLKNLQYKFNISHCSYFLKKNGKLIYIPINRFSDYICIIKKIKYAMVIKFPYLYGKNEDEIIYKLLLISYCKKKNFKYIKIDKNHILLFNNDIKNIENIILNLYIYTIKMKFKILHDENIMDKFIFTRLLTSKKISDEKIFIEIFYNDVLKYKKIIKEHYNIDINDVQNFNELYKKLKKVGFVNDYYNTLVPHILKTYKKKYKKISKSLDGKRNNYIKKIKKFSNINILKLIDQNIITNYNKTYIKNKFIELSKKYNI